MVITDNLPGDVTYEGALANNPTGLPTPSYNAAAAQLAWNLPVLSSGTYQLNYSVKVNDLVPAGTFITNNAQLTCPALAVPLASSTTVTVTGQFTVRIGVYNASGELVKTILTTQLSEPINVVTLKGSVITSLNGANNATQIYYKGILIGQWDGTNAAGDPATNGEYHIKIDNIDQLGSVTTITEQVMVSRSLYQSSILVYNAVGEVVRHLYAFIDDPGQAAVLSVQLSTSVIKPGYSPAGGTPSLVSIAMNSGATVVWDGKSDAGGYVQAGQYLLEIHTADGNGGQTTVTEQVSVLAADLSGLGTVISKPNLIDRSKGQAGTTLSINGNVTLHVGLYTILGELVGVADGVAGSGQAYLDTTSLASGLYLALVDIKDPASGLITRQTVKIAILH